MSDVEDELFAEDFAGDWTALEPYDCPPPETLPPAGAEIIERRLGIRMDDDDIAWLRKLAAVEWFFRNRDGQKVTYRQVLRGGSALSAFFQAASESEASQVDPPKPGDAAPTG